MIKGRRSSTPTSGFSPSPFLLLDFRKACLVKYARCIAANLKSEIVHKRTSRAIALVETNLTPAIWIKENRISLSTLLSEKASSTLTDARSYCSFLSHLWISASKKLSPSSFPKNSRSRPPRGDTPPFIRLRFRPPGDSGCIARSCFDRKSAPLRWAGWRVTRTRDTQRMGRERARRKGWRGVGPTGSKQTRKRRLSHLEESWFGARWRVRIQVEPGAGRWKWVTSGCCTQRRAG